MFLSKSMLLDYLDCPYKFYEKAVLKIPEPENLAMTQGKAIHKLIETFWNSCTNGHLPSIDVDSIEDSKVKKSAVNFLKMQETRFETLKSMGKLDFFKPVLIEKKLVNEKLELVGIIDAVDKNLDETLNIVEVKSYGKTRQIDDKLKFELTYYRYLLRETLGLHAQFGVLYMPVTAAFDKVELVEEDELWVKNVIAEVRDTLKANNFEHRASCTCFR